MTIRIYPSALGWHVEVRERTKHNTPFTETLPGHPFAFTSHSNAWVEALKLSAQYGWDIEAIYGQNARGLLDTEQGQEWDSRLPEDKARRMQ